MNPYSPIPRIVAATAHNQFIHRILRPDVPVDTQRIDLVTTSSKRVSIVDSGTAPEERTAEGDTAVHVLWQQDEDDASLLIGTEHLPVAPGDTAMIPAGDTWQLPANTLAIIVAVRSSALALPIAPTHGDYYFEGYNRESRYPGSDALRLSRWKVTTNLTLPTPESERVLIGLYNDLAIRHFSGVLMLPRGNASVIRPETGGITLVPNGLSYVLVID